MTRYPHLAARLFNTPLLIHPGKLSAIVAGLSPRFGVNPAPSAYATPRGTRDPGGYRVLKNGIALIEVFGALAHRGGISAESSYIQGYDTLAQTLDAALTDTAVRAIVLNIDSPGGEVAGAFQLAAQIHAARGQKPIVAVASDLACSAAYLIASACDSVSVTRTAVVGSIGVVTCHADLSRALDQEGVAVTLLYAGAHKTDGNPYQPLPPEVMASIQADVDHYYQLFISTVHAYRPVLTEAELRATEAKTYIGPQAIAAHLADALETPDQLIAHLAAHTSSSSSRRALTAPQGKTMSTEPHTPDVPETPATPDVPETPPPLDAVSIARLCNAARESGLTPLLLATPHTEAQVHARLAQAQAVRKICAIAKTPELTDALITAGATEDQAKLASWDALVARSEASPVDNTPPADIPAHLPIEDRCAAEWQRSPELRAEFGTLNTYQAYARAQAAGRVKTYGGKA